MNEVVLVLEQILSEGVKLIGIIIAFLLVFQAMNIVMMKGLKRRIKVLEDRLSDET